MRLVTIGVDLSSKADLATIAIWSRDPGGPLTRTHEFEAPANDGWLIERLMHQVRHVYPLGPFGSTPASPATAPPSA